MRSSLDHRLTAAGLLALILLASSCEGTGALAPGSHPQALPAPSGINPEAHSLSETLATIGATLGSTVGANEFLARALGSDQQIEAVKKARSYQESIEKKGKSKEVASVIELTDAVYAIQVSGTDSSDSGKMQVVLIDPATSRPVDDQVYTMPAVADNTLVQLGDRKVLVTPAKP